MNRIIKVLVIGFCLVLSQGCTKDFLDKKSNKALVVPKTLEHFQELLDNGSAVFNRTTSLTQVADGDFEVDEEGIASLSFVLRNTYLWGKTDVFEGMSNVDWNKPYEQVLYSNLVLEGLSKIEREDAHSQESDQIKGSALFMRGHALSQIVQQFAEPYNSKTADKLLGVPIRTSSDVNVKSKRGTLAQTYKQIISDIRESLALLRERTILKTRPSRAAAWAMLARVYLVMGEYGKAIEASNEALEIQDELIDYNNLDGNVITAFPSGNTLYNEEIIYYTERIFNPFYSLATVHVREELIDRYHIDDLRRTIFYTDKGGFKGSFGGSPNFIFTGLTTSEVYLIRAESYARTGRLKEAMLDLNTFMENRWKKSDNVQFIPFEASTEAEALTIILEERRKELVTRGLRWSDLRRLNKEPLFQFTLERTYQNEVYQLLPGDARFIYLIPQNEIEANGIEQNKR